MRFPLSAGNVNTADLFNTCDSDAVHLDGLRRVVVVSFHLRDLGHDVHALENLSEDWVLGLATREPIEVGVVGHVDEQLGSARVRPSRVCHRQGAGSICILGDVLVLDVSAICTFLCCSRRQVFEGAIGWATHSCISSLGILSIGATKLVHEAWNYTVEVDAVVEARLRKVNEVGSRARNPVQVDLRCEDALRRVKLGDGVLLGGTCFG